MNLFNVNNTLETVDETELKAAWELFNILTVCQKWSVLIRRYLLTNHRKKTNTHGTNTLYIAYPFKTWPNHIKRYNQI